jgi:hypothetical protein
VGLNPFASKRREVMDDWRARASMSEDDDGVLPKLSLSVVRWKGSVCEAKVADSKARWRSSVLRPATDCVRNPRRLGSVSSAYL